MNLTPLKYILLIENVLTVFRNYLCLKKRTRIIVVCWIVITIFNLILNAVINFRNEKALNVYAQRLYYYSSTGFSIFVMIAALYNSKKFYKLLNNLDAFYKIFDDEIYNQRMSKAQKCLTFMILLFCGTEIIVFTCVRAYYTDNIINVTFTTFSQFNYSVSDFRYIFEYFVLGSIFFVISEQLKTITRSIDNELSAIRENSGDIEHTEISSSVAVNHDILNKWVNAYENITNTSYLCNSMFSMQMTIMLLIVTGYYIMVLYTIALITVQGVTTLSTLLMNLFSMAVFLMALFVISRGGQKIQNSSLKLQQKLCEFCVHTIENEEYYKLAKDLLRCVRTRPVYVHVFGTLDVNMSMLPSIVAFFTTYTVIALQFNNVL